MKRFLYLFLVFCFSALLFQTAQGQTVNRKLYLKSGNLMDRTVPTGSTSINSSAFSKTGVIIDLAGSATTGSQADLYTGLSRSHLTTSNPDRLMIVSIASDVSLSTRPKIDSVKYGTQKLTLLDSARIDGVKIEVWYLVNPNNGTATVQPYWVSNLEASMGVVTFRNVDQENPILSYKLKTSTISPNNFFVNSNFGDFIIDAIATTANNSNQPIILTGGTQYFRVGSNSVSVVGSTRNGGADSTEVGYSGTIENSALIAITLSGNSNSETFKLKPALCNPAVIKAGKQIEIKTFVNNLTLTAGSTLNTTPPFRAVVTNKNNTELFSINKPTWNSTTKTFTWRKTLSSDITVPAGDSLHFTVINDTTNVSFKLTYGSADSASYVYLPFGDIAVHDSTRVFSATGASGFIKKVAATGTTVYVRDTVRMPLGTYSLNNYQLEIKQGGTASGTIISPTLLASYDCQRVYEYAWTPSSPGDYYIISRIGEGSDSTTYSLDTTIFSVCNPTLTPTLVNPTTGSSNGRIDLLLSNFIGNYTYNWSGQSTGTGTGNSITGLAAGTYAVTVNSVNGCQVTSSGLVLTSFTAPALTITGKVTNNCGSAVNQGAVEVVVTSANAGPYTYAWASPISATTRTISGLANGTYTVTVTDNYGTPATSLFTVATSSAITIGGVPTNATCALNDGKIVTTPSGGSGSGYTFKWSNGFSIQDIDKIPAGNYTVTVTDDKGCSNNSTITVGLTCNRKPLANDDSFSALKGASSITGNLATNDSDPDNNTLTYDPIDNPTASTQGTMSITPSGGITFTPVSAFVGLLKLRYKITDNGSGSLTDTAIVSLSIYNAGTDTICVSAGTARFAIDADPMYTTYAWTIPQGTSIVGSSTTNAITLNIASATPDTLGDVCVTVGNICGETSQKCYPVFLKKNTPIITAPAVCEGNDVSLTVSQNTTYSWTGPNSFTSNVRNPFLYNVPVSFNGGEYKVTTTDAFGCVGRDSILLQVNSNPTLTAVLTNANCGGADGAINITVANGVTPTYRWSNGAIVEDLTTITYGNYGITVTNSTGCAADTMFSVKDIQGPSITLTKTNVLCAQGLTGAIAIVSPYDNATNYSFLWTNGSTSNALASIPTGDYGVVVTDKATGCHGTANVLITEPDKLTLESTQTNVACAGNTGSITTIGKGGTGTYTYAWSSGPTTASLSSISAGTYTVTLTDANNCQVIQSFTITAPSTLAATASAVDVSCNAGTNGKVSLSVTGGSTPYRYLWSNGATTQNIQGLTAATYTVTVTDASNCSVIVPQAVTQLPALAISESITAVLCNSGNNGAINITASGGRTPYSYAWSNGITTEDLTSLTAQAYVVTVTDANGCAFSKSITVTQPTALALSSPVATNVSCFGGTNGGFTVSGSGGTSPLTYKWSTQSAFSSTSNISGLSAGSYSVTVKDANNCEVSSNSLPITQPTAIVVNATLALDSCGTGTKGKIDLTVSGGTSAYTYAWSKNGGGYSASTEDISSIASGTYYLSLTDASSCVFKDTFEITAPAALTISSLNPTNLACFGVATGSFSPAITGGITPYTYLWSNSATTKNINNLAAGTGYTLTVTDAYQCTVTSGPTTLTQPAVLSISNAALTQVNCNGGNNGAIDLTIAGGTPLSGNYVYVWSNGQTTQDLTGLKKGDYYVTVTDNNNCSVVGGPYNITDPTGFNITSTVQNVTCAGGTNGSINLAVTGSSGNYTYRLNGNVAMPPFNNLDSGNYVIRVADAGVSTCYTELTVNVSQPDSIKATKFVQNISCNGINDGSISLLPSGGSGGTYNYAWSNSAGNTFAITSLAPGKYVFTVTDVNACQLKDSVTLTGPSPLVVSGTKSDVLCFGQSNGSITLTNPSGGISPYAYFWSNGASTQNLSSLSTGFYSVTVTDANNCKDTLDFQVTQPAAPLSADIAATPAGCLGTDGKLVGVGLGGTAPYNYLWSNSLGVNQAVANVSVGQYNLTITDAKGCIANINDSIIVNCVNNFEIPDPDVNITFVNVQVTGSVATNDDVQTGTTYAKPVPKNGNPPLGVLVLNPNGTYTFISPNPGTYYYDIEVCAPGHSLNCPKTLLKIDVLPLDPAVKLPPVANHDVAYTSLNTPVTLKTINNDLAMEPNKILNPSTLDTISGLSSRNGTLTFNRTTGDITFTPRTGFTGIETYLYRICDNQTPALCDTASQTIYVFPATPPNTTQAADDYRTSVSGQTITGSVKLNDLDPEGHPTLVTPQTTTLAGKGTLTLLADGSFTFVPVPGYYGPISFPYTLCDNQSTQACANATIYLIIKPFLPEPDVNTTYVNIPVTGSVATNDNVPMGTTYKDPLQLNTILPGAILVLQPDGNYTFRSEKPGVYYYLIKICAPGQITICTVRTLKITVKDTILLTIIGPNNNVPCMELSAQNRCLASGKILFNVVSNCKFNALWLEKAIIYDENGQVAVGKINTVLPLSFTESLEVSVSDLSAGVSAFKQYELMVIVRDSCGVSTSKRLPFSVCVKAAPSLVCVQKLTTSLVKTDDGQNMQRIRAIDFFQDVNRYWSEGACSPIVAVGISRDTNVSFSYDSSVVVTCNDIGIIPVKVFLKDAYGNISFCSTFIKVEDNANLCSASNILKYDIAGVIRTVGKLPIPKVLIKLSGYNDRDLLTNEKGIYTFESLSNGFDYTVKPILDKDHMNGVSTFDLILITKHILGLKPLETPHQLIAADINRSGSISTFDLIQLRKLILNVTDHFPNNTSWRFIREGYIFPNLGNLWTNNFPEIFNLNNLNSNSYGNFVGIKIGDVSGNVNPSNTVSSVIRSDKKAVPLNVIVKSLANGQVECTLFIPYQEQPDGFQFTLKWENGLSLINVLPKMLENEHFGSFIPENMLTFSWNGDKKSGELVTLTFQTPDGNWSNDYLYLTNRLTPVEAYFGDETVGMKLTFPEINNMEEAKLLQNYPNPFQQVTNLPFYLPEAGEVVIEISNLSGKLVKVIKSDFNKGIHQVSISKNDLQSTGVYLATMKYKSQLLINKLVMVND